jgi:hypothetical protein
VVRTAAVEKRVVPEKEFEKAASWVRFDGGWLR